MFQFVKIHDHKGIGAEPVVLCELSKINIICGKNNSGKTTVLEGINAVEHSYEGRQLSDSDIATILTVALRGVGWSSKGEPHSPENRLYRSIMEKVAQQQHVWYSDQGNLFAKQVRGEQNKTGLSAYASGGVDTGFNLVFSKRPKTVLLPPKRHLEFMAGLSGQYQILPTGSGIAAHLFYSRNQSTANDDYQALERVKSAFAEISGGYTFDQFIDKQNNHISLYFAETGRTWRPAADCGLGLQDLLVILFFAVYPEYDVVLIEEPESHLHPELQRRLLSYLKNHSDKQYFVSTHSNVFLDSALFDRVYYTSSDQRVEVTDATSRATILNNLGYSVSDNLVSDIVILVEGPKDVPVVREFLDKHGLLQQHTIKVWPLGGDIMDQLDLSVLSQNYQLVALIDSDPRSAKTRERFKKNCEEYKIPVHQLKRYALENYFTVEALRKVFREKIPAHFTKVEADSKIEEQLGFNVKKSNGLIAKSMSLDDIEGTDLASFFLNVKVTCEKKQN